MTLLTATPAISTWGGASPLLTRSITAAPAISSWASSAPTIIGGASSSPGGLIDGGAVGKPRRYLIPGYERGARPLSPAALIATTWKELEKLQRAQPNTDTVAIVDDYELGPDDRTLLVDTSIGDVTITLKPAKTRFALPLCIVKISRDFNNVRVLAAAGDSINDALGLAWTDPFVAYSMHPDGTHHWWLEGIHDEVTPIAPGAYVVVLVDKKGRVRGGAGTINEDFITLRDVLTLNASTTKHGLVPKLPGDATRYLDGTGAFSVPVGSSGANGGGYARTFLFMGA